jgi:hypothetical protein
MIRTLGYAVIALLFIAAAGDGAPVVRKGVGANSGALDPTVFQFRADLGGTDNNVGGSYVSGYRNINWDEVPNNVAINSLPPEFYNVTTPMGVMLSSECTIDDFKVSATAGSGIPLHFGNYNVNYTTDFQSYIGTRLFSANTGACNFIDVTFYVPGTKTPATVSGFGLVFLDVDFNQSTGITCFGIDGRPLLARQNANGLNNGLSFLGVSFNNGERIARVRIFSGTAVLGDVDASRGGSFDVVVMDSFFYGEPRAIGQHSSDFDGDGTSDYSVFRPNGGIWYTLRSGSNTFTTTQFGAAGDIPVDGDFDGDSRNDVAVFRPANGVWYILRTSNGMAQIVPFGQNGDRPLGGDYDKDGISAVAVWRPADGNYYVRKSSDGQFLVTHWGANGDIPIGTNAAF